MALTKEDVKKLCEPLPLESGHSVKVKAESKPDASKQWALWLVYTEEGPITERLNEADPNWEFEITDKWTEGNSSTVYGRLTVCGVMRDCVGSGNNPNAGDAQKGAATDALKRGARLFGVGRYLLDAPQFYTDWATKTGNNRRTRTQEKQWEKEAFAKFAEWYRREFGEEQPSTAPRQQSAPEPPPSELDDKLDGSEPDTRPRKLALETFPFNDSDKYLRWQDFIAKNTTWNKVFWPAVAALGLSHGDVHDALDIVSTKVWDGGNVARLWLTLCEEKIARDDIAEKSNES